MVHQDNQSGDICVSLCSTRIPSSNISDNIERQCTVEVNDNELAELVRYVKQMHPAVTTVPENGHFLLNAKLWDEFMHKSMIKDPGSNCAKSAATSRYAVLLNRGNVIVKETWSDY